MKTLSIILLTSLLILGSCGTSSLTTLSSTQGFKITYPTNFVAGKDTSKGISLTDKTTGTIIVVNKTAVVTPKTNNEIIQWYNSNSPIDNSGEFVANGKKGAFVEFTNKYPTFSMYHRDSWIHEGKFLYAVACTTKESEKTNIQKICNDISLSLQIQ